MSLASLIGGSTLGTIGGLVGWFFLGLTGAQAFFVYLSLGLALPVFLIVLFAVFSGPLTGADSRISPSDTQAA